MVTRLTAAKEVGAVIEYDGKKVALGIPDASRARASGEEVYAHIPLRKAGTPDEASGAVLLYVCHCFFFFFFFGNAKGLIDSAFAVWLRRLLRMFPDILWKLPAAPEFSCLRQVSGDGLLSGCNIIKHN